jgi:imidazolonepropionase-like amidohydrolase
VSWYAEEAAAEMSRWPGLAYAPPESITHWTARANERAAADPATLASWAAIMESNRQAVRSLADAGVELLVSTSGGWFLVPGFSMFVELRCLHDAGLTNPEILRAATFQAARRAGQKSEWGSIRPGLSADLVLLDANPLEELRAAERVRAVVRRGRLHDREDLDRRLNAIRTRIAATGGPKAPAQSP